MSIRLCKMVMGKGGRILSGQPWNAKELVRYQRTVFEYGGTSFLLTPFGHMTQTNLAELFGIWYCHKMAIDTMGTED